MAIRSGKSGVTLGVVALSRNEERDLGSFLQHLLPWVDEIILVDDGSEDQTKYIAEGIGGKVKIVEHKMSQSGGFAEQRNIGVQTSQADWVLNMDVDERVTPELANEILVAISDTNLNGFRYRRLNFFAHRPMRAGGWASWNNPQLARRGYHRYVNALHERCVIQGEPESVGQLKSKMWHLNDESYKERLRKSLHYSQIKATQMWEGDQVSLIDIFARPILEFMMKYFIKLGLIDGVPGLIAAMHSAGSVFRSYALVWDQQNRIPREQLEAEFRSLWSQKATSSERE